MISRRIVLLVLVSAGFCLVFWIVWGFPCGFGFGLGLFIFGEEGDLPCSVAVLSSHFAVSVGWRRVGWGDWP